MSYSYVVANELQLQLRNCSTFLLNVNSQLYLCYIFNYIYNYFLTHTNINFFHVSVLYCNINKNCVLPFHTKKGYIYAKTNKNIRWKCYLSFHCYGTGFKQCRFCGYHYTFNNSRYFKRNHQHCFKKNCCIFYCNTFFLCHFSCCRL